MLIAALLILIIDSNHNSPLSQFQIYPMHLYCHCLSPVNIFLSLVVNIYVFVHMCRTHCHSQVLSQKELCDERVAAAKLEVQKKMEKLIAPPGVSSQVSFLSCLTVNMWKDVNHVYSRDIQSLSTAYVEKPKGKTRPTYSLGFRFRTYIIL